jgi:hypothetical protein
LVYSSSPAPWLAYVAVISAKEQVNNLGRTGTAFELFLLNSLCPGDDNTRIMALQYRTGSNGG